MREIKLLLVDDEQDFVETLAERLRLRDFGSTVALDGETALSIVQEGVPDVMLLDIMMPGINGLEVLERVKENYPNVQVIIVTGHGGEKEKTRAMQLGAFAYMTKPVDFETLIITIMAAFEQINVEP
ncbi:response regulator [Halodesulfovibrio sp. MK-HDV]|jgi:DNA-binding response OmpR family regulator|uniref:response regulator n=1 Tax=Halodesulfovibrio sp. MK-HDV TaxID=2599925 RepID=UPI00136D3782|nr:response regulator [Halodesulfovibrio sp. MK-HDV]KAF1075879.1 Transcriptional regulatory protein WalR [Halodesulfovibrio sp. MK-HDV]